MNLIGTVGNAFYTPEPNPAYGAKRVGDEWVAPDGTYVTHHVENGLDPSQPFIKPGFASRLFSPNAQNIISQNALASEYPGQQAQALQAEQNRLSGLYNTQTGNMLSRAGTLANQPNNILGALSGMNDFNPENVNIFGRTVAEQNAGVPQAVAGAQAAEANKAAASAPSDANPLISQNAIRQSMYVDPYSQLAQEAQALYPGLGGGGFNIGHIDPNSGIIGSVRNPIQSPQNLMLGNYFNGGNVSSTSGGSYMKPPTPLSVPGLNGIPYNADTSQRGNGQTEPFKAPITNGEQPNHPGITPVEGTEYSFDKDGNVFFGAHGEFVPPEELKDTSIGKAIQHSISTHKAIESARKNANLPHGKGYIIGKTIGDTLHQMFPGGPVFQPEFAKAHPLIANPFGE